MKRISSLAAALAFGVACLVPVAPAHAGNGFPGGKMYHGPDDGFDNPIPITCNWDAPADRPDLVSWSGVRWVSEGDDSRTYCGRDADGIYVYAGAKVRCEYRGAPWIVKVFDETRWHKISDVENYLCVHQLD